MKKNYIKTTKNLYFIEYDNMIIFYSYSTPIAFTFHKGLGKLNKDLLKNSFLVSRYCNGYNLFISKNVWSVTTAKHLTWVENFHYQFPEDKKKYRMDNEDFNYLFNTVMHCESIDEIAFADEVA